jgi:hypothetical protein
MTMTVDLDDLLDNEQTSSLLGIKPNTLEIWRHKGKGPPFLKLGDTPQAPVRYLGSALMGWLRERSFASTSAYSPAAQRSVKRLMCRSTKASARERGAS